MELLDLLAASTRLVAFTGAGVSTESGIPDFRSPGGVWTRFDPRNFEFDRYVEDARVRAESWAMRKEFFTSRLASSHLSTSGQPPWAPNPAHVALARLEEAGRSLGVITQNIDGLHQDAGSRTVIELHGTARKVMCIGHHPTGGTP
ncbi:MAG TPA: Sir2 family NAD-dependent protein deacetylase, partial [Nocardioidaceae bacterium]|nr:Sir2 family NAD-dependent protein deacetylase [Nocardioidaceae bacterium]